MFTSPSASTPVGATKPEMLCPSCLRYVAQFSVAKAADSSSVARCPLCKADVPWLYANNDAGLLPATFSVLGLRSHGKSVFLGSLFHELDSATIADSPKEWPNFSYSALDQAGLEQVRNIQHELEQRNLPAPTDQAFFQPTVLRLRNIPRFGSRHLLAYDTSGELLQNHAWLRGHHDGYLSRVPTIMLIVSWKQKHEAEKSKIHLDGFITIYLEALAALGTSPSEQNLLVVLSKGDRLLTEPDVPLSVLEFLRPDPNAWEQGEVLESGDKKHFILLDRISQEIEIWLEGQRYFAAFVNEARVAFKRVEFCVATATGHEPENNTLRYDIAPRGVLSSLLWAIRLQTPDPAEEQEHRNAIDLYKKALEHPKLISFCRQNNKENERIKALNRLKIGRGRTSLAKELVLSVNQ